MFYNCHDQMVFINMYSCQYVYIYTLQKKMKLSIKDFFSKCDQICKKLWIWSNLLKKSLMENFIFCVVKVKGNTTERLLFLIRRYFQIFSSQYLRNSKKVCLEASYSKAQGTDTQLRSQQTYRMESLAAIVDGLQPVTIVAKFSNLDAKGNPDYTSEIIRF